MSEDNKHRKLSLQEVLSGNIFTREFIRKQYKLLILIAVLLFVYIYNGFSCESQERKIVRLQEDVKNARYEMLDLSAEYTQLTRPSNVAEQLRENGSRVKESTTPSIMIDN